MGYLEKIFLGTMALFALVIFFIFALYFDVGDMMTGQLDRRGAISRGAAVDRVVDSIERRVRRGEPQRKPRKESFGYVPRVAPRFRASVENIKKRYDKLYGGGTPRGEQRVEQYRRFLRSQGFVNADFIEMEALAQDRTVLEKYVPAVDVHLANGDFDLALKLLEKALKELNPKNVKLKQEILSKMVQAHLYANDLDAAQTMSMQAMATAEAIVAIKSGTKLMETEGFKAKVDAERSAIAHRRDTQNEFFADLKRRKKATGRWDGFLPEERAEVKAGAMAAKASGKIDETMYNNILRRIEGGTDYRKKPRIERLRSGAEAALDK